jgi:hypothetical protein
MREAGWVLALLNIICGLLLFFAMSGMTSWVVFATRAAKVFPFIIGMLLLGNGVYFGLRLLWHERR